MWHHALKFATGSVLLGTYFQWFSRAPPFHQGSNSVTDRIPSLGRDRHFTHALRGVGEVGDVEASGRIVPVSEEDGGGVEGELGGRDGLLPGLQGGHGVVAKFVGESSDRVGGVVEGEGGVVVVVIWAER